MKNRYDLVELPSWEHPNYMPNGFVEDGAGERAAINGGPYLWGNALPPPTIGTRVNVIMNGFGPGVVESYFIEHGFLGVRVRPDVRPEWHIKQNGPDRNYCLVFGTEIRL